MVVLLLLNNARYSYVFLLIKAVLDKLIHCEDGEHCNHYVKTNTKQENQSWHKKEGEKINKYVLGWRENKKLLKKRKCGWKNLFLCLC